MNAYQLPAKAVHQWTIDIEKLRVTPHLDSTSPLAAWPHSLLGHVIDHEGDSWIRSDVAELLARGEVGPADVVSELSFTWNATG
jgi:hypothetical protein